MKDHESLVLKFRIYTADVRHRQLPAISGPSLRASISGDFFARFPVSRHSIGTVDFVGLNFGYAAIADHHSKPPISPLTIAEWPGTQP